MRSSPRKRGPIFQSRWLWVPSISAFTRFFDALCAGTTALIRRIWRDARSLARSRAALDQLDDGEGVVVGAADRGLRPRRDLRDLALARHRAKLRPRTRRQAH